MTTLPVPNSISPECFRGGLLIALVLCGFALSPAVQAVSPPPDGGYPGGNTAEGQSALLSRTTGGFNTAVVFFSLRSDTTGSFNTAIGAGTLLANTGVDNTAIGAGALLSNTTGLSNTANGAFALLGNTTGTFNTANGYEALSSNTTGGSNTAFGGGALGSNTTGIGNTALGIFAGGNVTTASNVICIGAPGANVNNSCYVGQIFAQPVGPNGTAVFVDSDGKLGTMPSSRRFKHDIKPMAKSSEVILALKPVRFHYKSDNTGTPQFGLIAEEVAAVNPDLVVRNENGEIYTVRYDAVNAMLLNEFLKEHKKVEKQEATITRLTNDFQTVSTQQRNEIQLLSAQLKEQATQIQKVSAQLEASKPAARVVSNQ